MRNFATILAAAAVCGLGVFSSCSKESIQPEPLVKLKEVTLNVEITKLSLQADDSVFWTKGDQISVFNNTDATDAQNTQGGYTFTADESGANVTFTGSVPEAVESLDGWVAYYKYATTNKWDGTKITANVPYSFSDFEKIYPRLAGRISGDAISMKLVSSLLEVTLSREDITSLRLRGNAEEHLAGYPQITFDADGNPVWSNSAADGDYAQYGSILFSNADGFTPGTYYIPVPATNFASGITLTFTKKDDATVYAELVGTKALNIGRGVIKSLGTVDANLNWKKGVQFSSIDYPTKGAKGAVWPFTETAAKSSSADDVKTYTTKAEDAVFKVLAQNSCGTINGNGQGVKLGNYEGDYIEFPTYSGYGLSKVVVVSGNYNSSNACEYCLKNGTDVIGTNWTNSTRGAKHTWEIEDLKETAYRFEIVNAGQNITLQRLYLYYEPLPAPADITVTTTALSSEYLRASDEGEAVLSGSASSSILTGCGIEYRVYGSNGDWTSVDASGISADFSATLTGLTDYERYEYRAWASTSNGTYYGNTGIFTLSDKNGGIRMDITLANSSTSTDNSYYNRFVTTYLKVCSTSADALTAEVSFTLPTDKDQILSFSLFNKSDHGYGYRTAGSPKNYYGLCLNYNDTGLGYLKLPEISGMKLYGFQAVLRDKSSDSGLYSTVDASTCAGETVIEDFSATSATYNSVSKYAGMDTPWEGSVYFCAQSKAVTIVKLHLRYVITD